MANGDQEWAQEELNVLREVLSRLYPTEGEARAVSESAGLNNALIAFDRRAAVTWFEVLRFANLQHKVGAVVSQAVKDHPENEVLKRAAQRKPMRLVEGPELTNAGWNGPTGRAQLEKILGSRSTLIPVSYLELGLKRSAAVVYVDLGPQGSGSGFLIKDNILITNNHVIPDKETAKAAEIWLNYQKTIQGLDAPKFPFKLKPDEFFRTSPKDQNDWTAVKVDGDPNSHEKGGWLELKPSNPKVGDHVNIIQHPGGVPKSISYAGGAIAAVGGNIVQYLTDTQPGSSGSPVFDTEWNLVALHHSGGWLAEPNSNDPKTVYYRNEGISINALIEGLK
jgi:V8-like Glu-specific endopeptidase